jgi:hypothetical protein
LRAFLSLQVELFPWLSADATDPVHPDPELEGSVAEVHLDNLIAPANFVFLFSNELYKVGHLTPLAST